MDTASMQIFCVACELPTMGGKRKQGNIFQWICVTENLTNSKRNVAGNFAVRSLDKRHVLRKGWGAGSRAGVIWPRGGPEMSVMFY